MRIILLLIASMAISSGLTAQDLKDHIWEHRVIVLQTKDKNSPSYQNQLKEFSNSDKEFSERKIVLYQIENHQYKYTDFKRGTAQDVWKPLKNRNQLGKDHAHIFKMELIGLDGGVKLKSNEVVTKEALFRLIDSMPMRKNEMKGRR